MDAELNKTKLFDKVKALLEMYDFTIEKQDLDRPWGGFYVISENQAKRFIDFFFTGLIEDEITKNGKLSPKILIVAPNKRLSWQYHLRRAEIWKVLEGAVEVVTSFSDLESAKRLLAEGETVKLEQGERHRLVGINNWCVIAEIWQHTIIDHPSDEEDIVRLQDDYGR